MATSTRLLLGGFYLAAIVSLFLPNGHSINLPWHGWHFFVQTHRFELALSTTILVSLAAILFTGQRVLALVAAIVNGFYALGSFALLLRGFLQAGRIGYLDSGTLFLVFGVLFVPAVAAVSFFQMCRTLAPNKRWKGP
jgi:hypothetical protein